MNERQLQSFLSAAKEKSFSKAAKSNYISVQALIQQIDILEESIGFELFVRTKRGITLTLAGEVFHDYARQILNLYYDAITMANKEILAKLCIAVPEEQYPDFLLRACKDYADQYSETKISFITMQMTEHFQLVRNHMADCSFVGEPKESYLADLSYEPLRQDTYAFAMSPSHPLTKKELITSDDLDGVSVYCGNYPFMAQTFAKGLSHTKAKIIEIKGEYDFSIKSQVLLSDNLLVFPYAWKSIYDRYLTVIPSDILAGSIGIIYRKRAKKSMEKFVEFIKTYL